MPRSRSRLASDIFKYKFINVKLRGGNDAVIQGIK